MVTRFCAAASAGLLMAGGVLVPAQGQAAERPPAWFFGTWSDALSMSVADSQKELDRQRSAGVGLIRQYIWWDRIETAPGRYDWSRMDQLVKDASARGVQILPTLLYTPSFYSSKPQGSTSTAQFPPTDPQTLARFATAMVDRYGTGGTYWCKPLFPGLPPQCPDSYLPITYWEVWNEPDYPSWWKGAPNPAEYLELLKPVSTAIRAADPAAKVVLGAMTNAGGGTTGGYLEQLYELGAKDYFDVLSLNPYALDVGAMVAYIRGQRAIAARHGDAAKPVYITEYGWATGGNSTYVVVTNPQCQGALLYAATKRLWELRDELLIHAVAQFQWHDVKTTSTLWPHYAGVYDADDQPKPSLAAYRAAIAGDPAPAGMTLAEACPENRQSLDGRLQPLTVTKGGSGTGAVTSSPSGIRCGEDCSQEFQPGQTITLTATPDSGSTFAGWGGACSGTSASCTVTMTDALSVTADFTSTTPVGTKYEESAAALDGWSPGSNTSGTFRLSKVAGDTARFRFSGTSVKWLTRRGPGQGEVSVSIDGVNKGTFDLYATKVQPSAVSFTGLAPSSHAMVVRVLGTKNAAATDAKVTVDGFAAGVTTSQEDSPRVRYNTWKMVREASASSGSYRVASTAGHVAAFAFNGSSVEWITSTGPAFGQAQVYVDGIDMGMVDLYASTAQSQVVQAYGGLAVGAHTLEVRVLGTKNASATSTAVPIDAFVVR